ncbi:hypothetical protein, partial [Streptomyces cyaneofuscatus]|uniref:hypothetical protein n=1 Tax=Streptomyces cyaneofuscatus TaxID=66883 RepID=UPI0033AB77A0
SGWAAYLFPDYTCGFGGDGGETIQFFGGRHQQPDELTVQEQAEPLRRVQDPGGCPTGRTAGAGGDPDQVRK